MTKEIQAKGNILGVCLPARYVFAVLGNFGMAIVYGLKVNLSVAMVAMINHTAVLDSLQENLDNSSLPESVIDVEECQSPELDVSNLEDGEFNWSASLQGIILSCYFWGYLVSQIPGAYVAENFSAKWVMFGSVAINVISTLLTPLLTKLHFTGLIIARIAEGIGGGATFPAMHCMIASWAPPNERSIISTIIYVGTSLGTAVSIFMAGLLANSFGWESVFYVMGGLSCIWLILWAVLTADTPKRQIFISPEERDLIVSQLHKESATDAKEHQRPAIPWGAVMKSVPFWAILIAHCCSNWGWYMFLIEIPFYLKQVLKFNVTGNAIRSSLPFVPMLLFSMILGKTLDLWRSKKKISTTMARKIATGCCSIVPAFCLLCLCYIGCQHTLAVFIMSIGIVFMGAMFSGFLSNHIDIAPNFAGTLVALTNTVATIPGIVVPVFVGSITEGNPTIGAWRTIFLVTVLLFAIEFVVFTLFGSGKVQSWNSIEQDMDNESTELKEIEKEAPTYVRLHIVLIVLKISPTYIHTYILMPLLESLQLHKFSKLK